MARGEGEGSASPASELIVRPEAEADVQVTLQWYDERSGTAGNGSLAQLDKALAAIREPPLP